MHRDDQAEADRDLTGGDDDHDQREDLPSPLPHIREKPISARLAAFSISSRQSRITIGLRRTSTPPAPIAKTSALTARYQAMSRSHLDAAAGLVHRAGAARSRRHQVGELVAGRALDAILEPTAPARQRDRADRGDQQQVGGDLERRQEMRQQLRADLPGVPKPCA